jgi:hypothetical protein
MGQSKLTLQVLSAYLPWKVKAQYLDSENYEITTGELVRIDTGVVNGDGNEDVIITCGEQEFDPLDLIDCEFQLLLRPLSALTTPLKELDGKTPLQAVKSALWKERYGWPRIWTLAEYQEGKHGIVLHPTDSGISIRCVPDYYMITQSAFEIIRETLLSLHMDIFGLLDSGDALPLTDHAN